jgi:CRISPR-associated protein Csd2
MTQSLTSFLPQSVLDLYEVHNYRNAAQVLATTYPGELSELVQALVDFRLTIANIVEGGGNESEIPKLFSGQLRHLGWFETQIRGDLVVTRTEKQVVESASGLKTKLAEKVSRKERFIDGHKIDYVKGMVAFDLEWNSKDQTFDRDLYAFRAFFEASVIDVGILVTRSATLNPIFDKLGVKKKYGASTTWMGKLLYRLEAGRNGGCPVLVLGITPQLISDWK